MSLRSALLHAWNVFSENKPIFNGRLVPQAENLGRGSSYSTHNLRPTIPNERSIISSIYARMAVDISSISIRHVRTDNQDRYQEDMKSGLNNCLTIEANLDQAATAFKRDIVLTLFDQGCAAVVPVDTDVSVVDSGSFDILTLRVGTITQWYPDKVRISLYNEKVADRQEIVLPKSKVGIVENPLYTVMNSPNSTLQRLLHKLSLLDTVDEASASGKLDLIFQVPYTVRSDQQRKRADQRRQEIEFQLKNSKYGIAYADATEKVIQLNRPVENNLMIQIEFLTKMLYGQLGITEEIMNGTADQVASNNYWNRTVEPVLTAIVEEMIRKFLTKTARTQNQSVMFFKDLFKIIPIENLPDLFNSLSQNEIATSNELRQILGLKPHSDPTADKLVNSNINPQTSDQTNLSSENGNGNGNSNGQIDIQNLVSKIIQDTMSQN